MNDIITNEMPDPGNRWLYVYTDDSRRAKKMVKVGDTIREVETRVKEQDSTSNSEDLEVILTLQIPLELDGREFRDHMIHAALEADGRDRPRKNREWFVINEDTQEEQCAVIREIVQKTARDINSGRKELELTPDQYMVLEEALDRFEAGDNTLLMELAPRFGKTIWAMIVHRCLSEQVMVVATYWLSALTSFKTDITKFKEFENMVYLDASDDTFDVDFSVAMEAGKKIVVGVSLFKNEGGLDTKLEDLSSLVNCHDKWVFVDEADFGSWREGQKEIIDALCK